jgi:predicted transposase/invertase (TIGR01784 family)
MLIANPLYDGAFKYLMKDKDIARHFLSILLNREIALEGFEATEESFIGDSSKTGFVSQRMDFHATIIDDNGSKRKVLIELQKSHKQTDLSRFRRYLSKAYYDTDTVQKNQAYQEIIAIYILGFPLDIPVAVVRTSTKLIDASTQKELDAFTDDETFIRQLHHESIFIDVTKLSDKMQTRVDRLLSIFNQSHIIKQNPYSLDLPNETVSNISVDDFKIIERLNAALQDRKMREHLIAQAEFQAEINHMLDKEELIGEIKGRLEGKLEEKLEIAQKMKKRNTPIEYIIEDTGLSEEQINQL